MKKKWRLVFSLSDNRGTGYDRDAGDGEYSRQVDQDLCMDFRATPERYEWTGTDLIEFPGWQGEQDAAMMAKAQARMSAVIMAEEDRRSWMTLQHPNGSGVFHKATDTIERMLDRYADLAPNDPFPVNNGCWDDANGLPVPMTMGELKALWFAFLDRGTYNYGVRKYHVAAMLTAADPEQYDYSGGWA